MKPRTEQKTQNDNMRQEEKNTKLLRHAQNTKQGQKTHNDSKEMSDV